MAEAQTCHTLSHDGLPLMTEPIGDGGGKPVLVLHKVRRVMDAFTAAQPGLTFQQVQQRTGLPSSTCLRLLQTLVREGFLDRHGNLYCPGLALLRWGDAALAALDLVGVATPVLAALRDRTGESAALYVRDGHQRTVVAVMEAGHVVAHILRVGQVLPLYAGSAGKVLLAYDPLARAELEGRELTSFTRHTVVELPRLDADLIEVRGQGFAATFEERAAGVASMSAPVFDRTGTLVAALGITSPTQRFSPDRVPQWAPVVMSAGAELSRRLGHISEGVVRGGNAARSSAAGHD